MRKNTGSYFSALATGVRNALGRILPADGYGPVDLKLWAVQILIDRQTGFKREPVPFGGQQHIHSHSQIDTLATLQTWVCGLHGRHNARVNAIDIASVVHADACGDAGGIGYQITKPAFEVVFVAQGVPLVIIAQSCHCAQL